MELKNNIDDQHVINLTVELDEKESQKVKNTGYLLTKARLKPEFTNTLTREQIDELLSPQYSLQYASNLIMPKIREFINEETDYTYLIEPRMLQMNGEANLVYDLEAIGEMELKLPDLNEVEYDSFEAQDVDKKVAEILQTLLEHNARLEPTNEPIVEGNTISADITTIGSDGEVLHEESNKIMDFETLERTYDKDAFLGKRVDDTVTVELQNGSHIDVKINQVYSPELAELDDDFAAEVSEFDTIEELKNDYKEKEIAEQQEAYNLEKQNTIWKKLMQETKLIDTNERLVELKNSPFFDQVVDYVMDYYQDRPANFPLTQDEIDMGIIYNLIDLINRKYLEEQEIETQEKIDELVEKAKESKEMIPGIPFNVAYEISQIRDESHLPDILGMLVRFQEAQKALGQ